MLRPRGMGEGGGCLQTLDLVLQCCQGLEPNVLPGPPGESASEDGV